MENPELKLGDIVQISPEYKTSCFRGCLLIVTEPKSFGCQGYITGPGETFEDAPRHYYLRLNWEDFEICMGVAPWIRADEGSLKDE